MEPTPKLNREKPQPAEQIAPHPALTSFYSSPEERPGFVMELFDRTAEHYNWISRILSFGTDRMYRRMALRRAGLEKGMKVLDVASGTGLVAQAALELGIDGKDLVGVDPSEGMLRVNQNTNPVWLLQGRGERLPFQSQSFDFIVMGYALRHVEDLLILFQEFYRVLKPNGRILILEITRPDSKPFFLVLQFYMQKILPRFLKIKTGTEETGKLMEYYWTTIAQCVPPAKILEVLNQAGFAQVKRNSSFGLFSEYSAAKSGS